MTDNDRNYIDLSDCSTEPNTTHPSIQLIDLTVDDSTNTIETTSLLLEGGRSRESVHSNQRIFDLFGTISDESSSTDFADLNDQFYALSESEEEEESETDYPTHSFSFDPFRMVSISSGEGEREEHSNNNIIDGSEEEEEEHEDYSRSLLRMLYGNRNFIRGQTVPGNLNGSGSGFIQRLNSGNYSLVEGGGLNYRGFFDGIVNSDEHSSYESLLALGERLGQVKQKGLTRERLGMISKFRYGTRFPRPKKSKAKATSSKEETTSTPKYPLPSASEPTTSTADMCTICMDEFKAVNTCKEMPCKHLFHSRCLDRWLIKNASCPVCRHQLECN